MLASFSSLGATTTSHQLLTRPANPAAIALETVSSVVVSSINLPAMTLIDSRWSGAALAPLVLLAVIGSSNIVVSANASTHMQHIQWGTSRLAKGHRHLETLEGIGAPDPLISMDKSEKSGGPLPTPHISQAKRPEAFARKGAPLASSTRMRSVVLRYHPLSDVLTARKTQSTALEQVTAFVIILSCDSAHEHNLSAHSSIALSALQLPAGEPMTRLRLLCLTPKLVDPPKIGSPLLFSSNRIRRSFIFAPRQNGPSDANWWVLSHLRRR